MIHDGGSRTIALRCILCGDVIDRVILHHRHHRAQMLHSSRARPPIYGTNRWKKRKTVLS
jgi:hypothetical protein